ncbi:methionine/alanine import family NSS transporter small subunit [Williamsia sp.]|jgi:DMSO reductase anchor subunit
MSASAIVMMLIALILVWGGLIASIIHLRGNPDDPD